MINHDEVVNSSGNKMRHLTPFVEEDVKNSFPILIKWHLPFRQQKNYALCG